MTGDDERARLARDDERDALRLVHAETRERLLEAHERDARAEGGAVREREEVTGEGRVTTDHGRELLVVDVLGVAEREHLLGGGREDRQLDFSTGDALFDQGLEATGVHASTNGMVPRSFRDE